MQFIISPQDLYHRIQPSFFLHGGKIHCRTHRVSDALKWGWKITGDLFPEEVPADQRCKTCFSGLHFRRDDQL